MKSHIKSLDGLRGIAALMVIFFHFFNVIKITNQFELFVNKIAIFGQTGVSLFFVLSGFLITRILIEAKNRKFYFSNFYIKRTLRIFPLYYLFLLIFYFVDPILRSDQILPTGIAFWLYLQDIYMTFKLPKNGPDHYWSLAVEEHFYLFWPFVIYFFSTISVIRFSIFLIVISFILRYLLFKNGYEVFYFTFTRMDELILGGFLAFLELNQKLRYSSKWNYIILCVVIGLLNLIPWFFVHSQANLFIQVIKIPLIGLFYFSVIASLICLGRDHLLTKILSSNALSFTGRISYGVYVFHPIVFMYVKNYLLISNIFLEFFVSLFFVYLIATLSYNLFEKRFLDLKEKFVRV